MIRYPNITGKTDAQKLEQMRSYMHQLADELNYQLEKGGSAQNGNLQTARATAAAIAKPVKNDSAISSFNEIKALIIKSADIVDAYSESIKKSLEGEYVAVSDFGTYTEETQATLEANSKSITTVVEKQEKIESDLGNVENDLRSEIKQTADSIKLEVTDNPAGKTASIKLTVGDKSYDGEIDMTGLVTFTNLTDGKTEISGDNITTGQILADLIKAGVLKSKDGESVIIDLDNGTVNLVGVIKSQQEAGKRTMMTPETITAQSLYDKVYASLFPGSLQLQDAYEYLYSVINTGEWRMYDADGTYQINAKLDKTNQIALLELQGKAGSTLSIFSSNGGANHIRGLSNPIGSTDAATKGYVDTNFAPAGCGYGDAMAFYNIQDGTFEATLDQVLAEMPNYSARQIQFIDAAGLSTQIYEGTLWKYTASYAALNASNYNGTQAIKTKYDGTWRAWEFLNPGMVAGVENATLERYNHKTVYTMVIDCKTLPSQGQKSVTTTIPSNANVLSAVGIAVASDGEAESMPCVSYNGAIKCAFFVTKSKNIAINAFTDMSSYNGYVTVKYTKD